MLTKDNFHCFKCNLNDDFDDLSTGEYIKSGEPFDKNIDKNKINKYTFFGQSYDNSVWVYDTKQLFLLAEKYIRQLEQASKKNDSCQETNYKQIRKDVCELWLATRNIIIQYRDDDDYKEIIRKITDEINDIVSNITKLRELSDCVVFNCVKYQDLASYNYLHLYLDLRWIMLSFCNNIDDFERDLHVIFCDLIYVSYKKYEDNERFSPFLCSCFKEIWLLLQLLVEDMNKRQFCKDFWSYFNNSLRQIVDIDKNATGRESLFYLCFLLNIGQIQEYDQFGNKIGPKNSRIVSNFQLVEQSLKSTLQSEINEKQLRLILQTIVELQTKLWSRDANFNLLQVLWEHYYKRINTSFNIITTDTNPFITPCKLFNFVEYVEKILNSQSNTSYEMFLYLLSDYLQKNGNFWSKLKGRIYSKLSVSKLGTFNDFGLQNFITLFLVLSQSVNFGELAEKLYLMLSQLPSERSDENAIVWSAYLSIISMYIKQDVSIRNVSETLTDMALKASSDRRKQQLMQLYITGLENIVENSEMLRCSEHVLFSNWLGKYLQWCPHIQLCTLLDLLQKLLDKLKIIGVSHEWKMTIDVSICQQIINLSNNPDAPKQVAEVAATIVSIDGQKYGNIVEKLTGDGVNIEIVEQFLRSLLEKSDVQQITTHQTSLIQAWIRLSLLTINQKNLYDITQLTTKLPQWQNTIGVFHVEENEDSLHILIKFAGMRVRDAKTMHEIANLKRWFETCFGRMDKWISNILNGADKIENNKLLLRIYMSAALLFIHCAPALYTKNKDTSLFQRLVSTMLLPTTVLLNKRPSENMLQAIKMTWHMFVRGIVRFDYKNDSYIERIFKDFIVRYVPYLNDFSSPIVRCFDPELKLSDTEFVLSKIISLITYKSKVSNEFSSQALNLLLEMANSKLDSDFDKVQLFVQIVTPSLLEQLMFIENRISRQVTIQVLEKIKYSSHYTKLRDVIKTNLINIIDKHMAFYSTSVFQMLESLSKIWKLEIQDIVSKLKESIQKVERMRGVGYDNTLRKGLQDLENMMK